MCRFKYDVRTAARMLRDKVNEPWERGEIQKVDGAWRPVLVMVKRKRSDRITLADAEAYCMDVRDNHERMEQWRKDHPSEPYPNDIFNWDRSHERDLFTIPERGGAYCRMVEEEHHMMVNAPIAA